MMKIGVVCGLQYADPRAYGVDPVMLNRVSQQCEIFLMLLAAWCLLMKTFQVSSTGLSSRQDAAKLRYSQLPCLHGSAQPAWMGQVPTGLHHQSPRLVHDNSYSHLPLGGGVRR